MARGHLTAWGTIFFKLAASDGWNGAYKGMEPRERDRRVIDRVVNGDGEAFEMLVGWHEKPLYNFVIGHGLDVEGAADITQDAFLKAYRSIGSFDCRKASFKTWLYGIAFNLIRDWGRRQAVRRKHAREMTLEEGCREEHTDSSDFEMRDHIERLLGVLDSMSQNIVRMKFLDDLRYEDIASILGLAAPTVRSKMQRALKKMKLYATNEGGE